MWYVGIKTCDAQKSKYLHNSFHGSILRLSKDMLRIIGSFSSAIRSWADCRLLVSYPLVHDLIQCEFKISCPNRKLGRCGGSGFRARCAESADEDREVGVRPRSPHLPKKLLSESAGLFSYERSLKLNL